VIKLFVGEEPIHIKVENKNDIAPLVLMPGDPLRAKYIAETYLKNAKLVTSVRNMFGFTGTYKGVRITIMASGMGMPSMSIYAFELMHYFNVKKIIRIGTCGSVSKDVKIPELILADNIYSESKFAYSYDDYTKHTVKPSKELNKVIIKTAEELNTKIHVGTITTADVFGPYVGMDRLLKRMPKDIHSLGEEMEGFALCHIANVMNVDASVILTVVDSKFSKVVLTPEERQTSLNSMITLALESIIK
jgi:purine-nucleoside phosphorylase